MAVDTGELAFLFEMMRQESDLYRRLHLGYTIEEERIWKLFNRCCHAGRKIDIIPRPMMMAVGVPNGVAIRRTFSDVVIADIAKATQP